MTVKPSHWLVLAALTIMWGSSYLLIAISLRGFAPAEVAAVRLIFGAVVMLAFLFVGGYRFPRDRYRWTLLIVIAVVGNCIPFSLIAWGQQEVESGLAGILVALTPLLVVAVAHFVLPEGRVSKNQLFGFLLAFVGVVVLLGPESLLALGGDSTRLLAQLAILFSAFCYAISSVLTAKLPETPPPVTTASVLLVSSVIMLPVSADKLLALTDVPADALIAVAVLGVIGTAITTVLYFWLVRAAGPRFASLFNYLVPVWAVFLGMVVLDEPLSIAMILSLALIIGGVLLTQRPNKPVES